MKQLEELNYIEKGLEELFISDNEILSEIKNFISIGSKKIRSTIAILYLKANNKPITKEIITLLTAGEVIHNASLLHDDVLDNANLRRGNETVQQKFSPHVSILAGDLLLSYATEKLISLNNDKILHIFTTCTKEMSNSELSQYMLRGKNPSQEEYLRIIEGKTASLFEAVLKSSAILSGIDTEKSESFGRLFGTVFQIKNDLDKFSGKIDEQNGIKTAFSVLGVEKTKNLIDNYKKKMREEVQCFPNKEYSEALKDLAEKL